MITKRKVILLIIIIQGFIAGNTLKAQVRNEPYHDFTRCFFDQPCKSTRININGFHHYYFIGKEMMYYGWINTNYVPLKFKPDIKSGCSEDSIHEFIFYTPSIHDHNDEYFYSEPLEKEQYLKNHLVDIIMHTDTLNKYLKQSLLLDKLIFNITNSKFSDTVINHLCNTITSIDSLIIYDYTHEYEYDAPNFFKFPTKNQYFESVSYLKIASNYQIEIPEYVFEHKQKPLETIVFVCDSLKNLEGLNKLTSLKKLTFVSTKNMDAIMPIILRIKSIEELYIANTDIRNIPAELLKMPSLKTLVIVENDKLKKFPEDIKAYENLEHFFFKNYKTRKTRVFLDKISKLSKINPEKYQNY